MKRMIATAALFFISIISRAQPPHLPHAAIYIHALYATAMDNSSQQLYNGGAGGVAGILVGEKNTRFNASIGYDHFFADNGKNHLGDETYVPVKLGIRQYIPLTMHFLFIQGNAGIGFVNNSKVSDSHSSFAFDFGAGVKITAFEAALIWDNFHEKDPAGVSSWLTFQVGINLGL
jgi:hypothetical protein